MFTLYLIALSIGGTMLGASLFMGGHDVDVDVDADFDADADADADGGAGHGLVHHGGFDAGDAIAAWLPFASMRFWIFFTAFFGLTGTLLSVAATLAAPVVGAIALGFGYVSGVATTSIVKRLQKTDVDSAMRARDYIGARGQVVLGIGAGRVGKVRLQLRGRVIEVLATTDDDTTFAPKDSVMIYDVQDDGTVVVTKTEQLEA